MRRPVHSLAAEARIYSQGVLQAAQAPPGQADETLARARAGDTAAFTEIVRQYQATVFGLAYHFIRDRSVAEELAQEVFLELYRNLTRIDSPAHLTFWLRRVVSHRCIDHARRHAHRVKLAVHEVPERPVPPISRDFFLEERLRRVVAELPVRARVAVMLRYQEELEPAEIAAILDMPVNTVKSRLRRSLALLRAKLGRREERP